MMKLTNVAGSQLMTRRGEDIYDGKKEKIPI